MVSNFTVRPIRFTTISDMPDANSAHTSIAYVHSLDHTRGDYMELISPCVSPLSDAGTEQKTISALPSIQWDLRSINDIPSDSQFNNRSIL